MSHTCNEWLHGSCSIWSLDVSMKCVYACILRSCRLINANVARVHRVDDLPAISHVWVTTTTNATMWTRTYANQTHDEKRNDEDDAQQIHHNTIKPKNKTNEIDAKKIWGKRRNGKYGENRMAAMHAAYNVFIWSHDAPVATQRTIKMPLKMHRFVVATAATTLMLTATNPTVCPVCRKTHRLRDIGEQNERYDCLRGIY